MIGLVENGVGTYLEGNGIADYLGGCFSLRLILGDSALNDRNPSPPEQDRSIIFV
jgi:hypothetical protein